MNNLSDKQLPCNIMTLTGNGQISVVPDIAVIRLGVQSSGENLADIQQENARISQAILQALQQFGITEIRTFQYTIDKIFDFENGVRIDRGFNVRNILEIRTNYIDQVGRIIDTAVYYGANVVDLINFEVSNSEQYYQQALNKALQNAFQKAKSIAGSLGIKVDPIPRRITEGNVAVPFTPLMREGAAFATPIVSGSTTIEANVTVEYLY